MSTETLTLAEFLLARVSEDEADAVAAQDHPADGPAETWRAAGRYSHEDRYVFDATVLRGDQPPLAKVRDAPWARHIARHDPARVLADCEAKRRIVEMQRENDDLRHQPGFHYKAQAIEAVLRNLALPYADHPDYRDKWRPRA